MKMAKEVLGKMVRAILILALVTATAPAAAAQTAKAKANGASAYAKSRTAAKPSGGPQEGIKVYGHWVIEVRNPDGTLVTRREFENSLAGLGGRLLAQYLTHVGTPTRWTISMGGNGLTSPWTGGTASNGTVSFNPNGQCWITDAAASPQFSGTAIFPTLTASIGGANSDQIILTGNATALVADNIQYVATRQSSCSRDTAPADCNLVGAFVFTERALPSGIPVAQGQIVQVTVTLSFS